MEKNLVRAMCQNKTWKSKILNFFKSRKRVTPRYVKEMDAFERIKIQNHREKDGHF